MKVLEQEQKQGSSAAHLRQCGFFFLMELLLLLAATEYCCNSCSLLQACECHLRAG